MSAVDTFTVEQVDTMRRAMLFDTADDLELVRSMMMSMYESNNLAAASYVDDVPGGVRRLRVAFDAMETLGWFGGTPTGGLD